MPVRDVDLNDLPPMLERIRAVVCDDDYHLIEALATTVIETTRELRKTQATLTRVRRLFGLTGNEKTAHIKADVANPASQTAHPAVEPQDAPASDPSAAPAAAESAPEPSAPPTKEKRKGHGRVPASAYRAAQHVTVDHESLRRGDSCPLCTQGRVYELAAPATLVRIVGRAPLGAACFHCKQLRCGACGHVFTARPPPEAQGEKCDESASSTATRIRICGVSWIIARVSRRRAPIRPRPTRSRPSPPRAAALRLDPRARSPSGSPRPPSSPPASPLR